ncbi:MAG: hypoxanthine phosphoribosyltransferase [Clostridiales bacterium]|nr:hypoxanthine phosphoribosyltransferase [Clostridiales bacterium]
MRNVGTELISAEQIQKRIKELARELESIYKDKNPLMVGVLKGCVYFLTDLTKEMDMDLELDFMIVSSYGASTRTSGVVKIIKDLERNIEGRDVVIVEDIIDSGLTLSYLVDVLKTRNPSSVRVCTLLDKKTSRKANMSADFVGFDIPDEFVVGYGLDYAERYRNLPGVYMLRSDLI